MQSSGKQGLSPDGTQVDVERDQDGNGHEADVSVESVDLKSQEQDERKR